MPYKNAEAVASKGHESKLAANIGLFYPHEWRIEGASDERMVSRGPRRRLCRHEELSGRIRRRQDRRRADTVISLPLPASSDTAAIRPMSGWFPM